MEKKEFYYKSQDGISQIHAIKWIPEETPRAILQLVHGMSEYVERYEPLAKVINEANILVVGDDHLGHGKSVGEGQSLGYFCHEDPATKLVDDEAALTAIVKEEYPDIPYFILGHSMGSFIARNYIAEYGKDINGAIIVGTGMQPKMLIKASKMIAKVFTAFQGEDKPNRFIDKLAFSGYVKRYKNAKTPSDWLSPDENEVANYIDDPLCGFVFTNNGFSALFELIDRLHDNKRVAKIPKDLPILFLSGKDDPVGDYGEAIRKVVSLYRGMGMTQVDFKLYEGCRHEILNAKDGIVAKDVKKWLEIEISK